VPTDPERSLIDKHHVRASLGQSVNLGVDTERVQDCVAGGVTELGNAPVRKGETRDKTRKGRLRSKLADPAASISLGRPGPWRAGRSG
jgi:hypothetical protein